MPAPAAEIMVCLPGITPIFGKGRGFVALPHLHSQPEKSPVSKSRLEGHKPVCAFVALKKKPVINSQMKYRKSRLRIPKKVTPNLFKKSLTENDNLHFPIKKIILH